VLGSRYSQGLGVELIDRVRRVLFFGEMGLLVFNMESLPPPFQTISESTLEISNRRGVALRAKQLRLIFVLGGAGKLRFGDDAEVPLAVGDVFALAPGFRYTYLPSEGRATRLQVLAIFFKAKIEGPARSWTKLICPDAGHACWRGSQNAEMLHLIHQLRAEGEGKRLGYGAAAASLATLLILTLLRADRGSLSENPKKRTSRYLVDQAREFIFKNFDEELTLAGVAWYLRLSEEYLARLFKQETGQTVFDFVRECRLNAAKRLLTGTNETVVQIASVSGFSSASVFCRMFRKVVGCSPSAYRAERAGNPNFALRNGL